jgi:hypothetical protein
MPHRNRPFRPAVKVGNVKLILMIAAPPTGRFLATTHPATARRVSLRLAHFFVADAPSPALVKILSDALPNNFF